MDFFVKSKSMKLQIMPHPSNSNALKKETFTSLSFGMSTKDQTCLLTNFCNYAPAYMSFFVENIFDREHSCSGFLT